LIKNTIDDLFQFLNLYFKLIVKKSSNNFEAHLSEHYTKDCYLKTISELLH